MRPLVLALVLLAATARADARVVCPSGETVDGVDVSKHQGPVRWRVVRHEGVRFAFLRVSDGLDHPDEWFSRHWVDARAAGLLRGAYQFFRPGDDPIAQARLVEKRVGKLAPGDLPPVLDIETLDGMSPEKVIARMKTWLARVGKRTGRTPIIYSNPSTWQALGTPDFGAYPLWVAHYATDCPAVLDGWGTWHFWQHTEAGRLRGVDGPADLDRWNGSIAQLERLAGIQPPRRKASARRATR